MYAAVIYWRDLQGLSSRVCAAIEMATAAAAAAGGGGGGGAPQQRQQQQQQQQQQAAIGSAIGTNALNSGANSLSLNAAHAVGVQQLLDLQAARALMKTAAEVLECMGRWHRYSVYSVVKSLYWYKSTNTGSVCADEAGRAGARVHGALAQVHPVTCFTGSIVQILTHSLGTACCLCSRALDCVRICSFVPAKQAN